MTKAVISLHDQATELRYPENFHQYIELLFGPQARNATRRATNVIAVQEIGPDRYSIDGDIEERAGDDLSLTELLDVLLAEVVRSLIHKLDSAVALHSASIGWRGKCILIPGLTGAGKSSLAAWFVANNFEFLSDELVVLPESGSMILSFPRPLLAKSETDELIAILARNGRSQTVRIAANVVVCRDSLSPCGEQKRQAGLIIFPQFVAGRELEFASVTPAMASLKLMECNLNARNLGDHGLRTLAAFARSIPALRLTYGNYEQLEGVADTFAKFILETDANVAGLQKFTSAFRHRSGAIIRGEQSQYASAPPVSAPAPLETTSPGGTAPVGDPFASVWDDTTLAQQRRLLQRTLALAESRNIALYLYWGTLLGHVREGGILPWDDDVDLALFDPGLAAELRLACEDDRLKIHALRSASETWIKVFDPSYANMPHPLCPWTWPCIDIFIYAVDPMTADGSCPALAYPHDLIFPGRVTMFEGARGWEPEQPLAVLDLQYPDWRRCEQSPLYSHRREEVNEGWSTRRVVTDIRGRKVRQMADRAG